jgi:hypothetical protein
MRTYCVRRARPTSFLIAAGNRRKAKMIAFKKDVAPTVAVVVGVAVFAGVIAPGSAEARRAVKPYYSETYETRRPARGYEGFLFPDYYCSYKRYPNRACSVDARGRERCRVVGWRLEQTCQ